jgi:DNA-binding beta-propeller fold protein YncE
LEILSVSGIGQAEAANLLIYQAGKQVFIQNNGSANTMSISITNTLGQLVFKQDYQSALQEKIKIDLSKQANGVYFVNAYIGNAMMTQKITLTN